MSKLKLVFWLEDEAKQLLGEKSQAWMNLDGVDVMRINRLFAKYQKLLAAMPQERRTKGLGLGAPVDYGTPEEQEAFNLAFQEWYEASRPFKDICDATGALLSKQLQQVILRSLDKV